MHFEAFAMERWQSAWENQVRFNLSESGVHPMSASELLALGPSALLPLEIGLGYPQSNGTEPLRSAIASLYPGANAEQVLVTTGSSEANFVNLWTLVSPGDRVAVVAPTYMQTWSLAKNLGAEVQPIWLREALGWQPNPDDIERAIADGTKLVVVTHPNNPTGAILSIEAMDRIAARASRVGAWLLADEVFLGAERAGAIAPSFWGRSEKLVVVAGLSKAYGLPGLRIGWSVGPAEHTAALWAHKEYTSIAPAVLSDALATFALGSGVRARILERTRGIVRANWELVETWLLAQRTALYWRAPDAGAIVSVRYPGGTPSTAVAEMLRREHDVLVVPGSHFGLDGFLRIGFGMKPDALSEALERISLALR